MYVLKRCYQLLHVYTVKRIKHRCFNLLSCDMKREFHNLLRVNNNELKKNMRCKTFLG